MRKAIERDRKKPVTPCLLRVVLSGVLLGAVGVASAAGPEILTDKQMDSVSAGFQQSYSSAAASALLGFATTVSQTTAFSSGPVTLTGSTSAGVAAGIGAGALAGAGTIFR